MNDQEKELEASAYKSLKEHYNTLSATPFALTKLPSLSFNQRGAIAGTAILNQNHIRLNRALLKQHPRFFTAQVVPHELAHLAVFYHFGRVKPHGKEWKMIMTEVFLLPANRCHELPLQHANVQLFRYRCDCRATELGIRRHNKVQRGQTTYVCKDCGSTLRFEGNK